MSSLAEIPELVGFFSYSREDDEDFRGTICLEGPQPRSVTSSEPRRDNSSSAPRRRFWSPIRWSPIRWSSRFFSCANRPPALQKRQLLYELVPTATTIGLLVKPANPNNEIRSKICRRGPAPSK